MAVPERRIVKSVGLHLPFPPSVNALFANAGKKGRVKTARYSEWIEQAGYMLNSQQPGRCAGPYHIKIVAASPDKRRRDLGNIEKPISDLLQKMGVIDDDSMAQSIALDWRSGGTEPGVDVLISAVEGVE